MANQDALSVFRRILAEGQVCTCLCSHFCFINLHVLTTIVTTVQISVDTVHSDLAKGLVRRGSLVEVEDVLGTLLEFPSTLHAEYFRQAAVCCHVYFASESVCMHMFGAVKTGTIITCAVQLSPSQGHPYEGTFAQNSPPSAAGAHH